MEKFIATEKGQMDKELTGTILTKRKEAVDEDEDNIWAIPPQETKN